MAGGAAVWCWCDVLPVCCFPVLYSYVGRGGVRSPTGAGHHRPGAARRGAWACPAAAGGGRDLLPARASSARRGAARGVGLSSGGGRRARSPTGAGIIGPARPVRGDLSSGAGCCCPLLYSYVGRGGGRSPTGAASSARRGAVAGRGLSSVQRWRSPTGAASSSRPRKTPHGKRATKKR